MTTTVAQSGPPKRPSRLWTSRSLGRIKTGVEILAIVVAGCWAFFEYGLKEYENRQQGLSLRRANLNLEASVAPIDESHSLIHARLLVRNPFKRRTSIWLTSWWLLFPGEESYGPLHSSEVTNDATLLDLAPGEETELSFSKIVDPGRHAAVVHTEVIFADNEAGEPCMLVPTQSIPDGGVEEMNSQPSFCSAHSPGVCGPRGCSAQRAERLLNLERTETK